MGNKKELYRMGVLSLIERAGGETAILEQIAEAARAGRLTRKQAHDLRKAVQEAGEIRTPIETPNETIEELDRKVDEAFKLYR